MTDTKDVKVKLTFDLDEASLAKAKIKAEKEINEMSGRLLKTPGLTGDMINMSPKEMGALSRSVMRQQETNGRKQIQFREAQERREYNARERVQSEGAGLFGGYQMRRGARMIEAGKDLVSAQTGVKASTVSFGKALGATIGELAPMAMAMGAVSIASMALSAAFNLVEQTGMEVVGALSQIAGAKGLQQMLVDAAGQERQSAKIAGLSGASTGQVMDLWRTMSKNSEFGDKDIGAMLEATVKTGGSGALGMMMDQNGKPNSFATFQTDLASASMTKPENIAKGMAVLKNQFPQASTGQLQDTAANLWQIGTQGGPNFFDNPQQFSKLFPEAKYSMNGVSGQAALANQLAKSKGGTARQSYTKLTQYEEKNQGLGNLAQQMMNSSFPADSVPGAFRERFQNEHGGEGPKTQQAAQEWINAIQKTTDSMTALDAAIDKNKDTAEWSMQNTWNKVTEEIEGGLLPVLRELVQDGTIQRIADMFREHKDDIVSGVQSIAHALPSVAQAFVSFLHLMAPILHTAMDLTHPGAEAQGIIAQSALDNEKNQLIKFSDKQRDQYKQQVLDAQDVKKINAVISEFGTSVAQGENPPINNPPADYTNSGEKPLGQVAQQKHLQVATQHLDVLQIIQRGIEQQNNLLGQIKTNTGKPIILPPNASGGN